MIRQRRWKAWIFALFGIKFVNRPCQFPRQNWDLKFWGNCFWFFGKLRSFAPPEEIPSYATVLTPTFLPLGDKLCFPPPLQLFTWFTHFLTGPYLHEAWLGTHEAKNGKIQSFLCCPALNPRIVTHTFHNKNSPIYLKYKGTNTAIRWHELMLDTFCALFHKFQCSNEA